MNSLGSGVDVIVNEGVFAEMKVGDGETTRGAAQAVKNPNKMRVDLFNLILISETL